MISIIIPAYNEEDVLESTAKELNSHAKTLFDEYEIIISVSSSGDRTLEIAKRLQAEVNSVKYCVSNTGKGRTVMNGFRESGGHVLAFMDADMSTDIQHLEEMIRYVDTENFDIAIGSRRMPDAQVNRSVTRTLFSEIFNMALRVLLGSDIHDHNCGFKAFDRDVVLQLDQNVEDKSWFWDGEILILAQRMGHRIKEFPVVWEEKGDSAINLLEDSIYISGQILRCYWKFNIKNNLGR